MNAALVAVALSAAMLAAGSAYPAAEDASALLGNWRGSYACGQGRTGLLITIRNADGRTFDGEFAFYPMPDNPDVPTGRFRIEGGFEPGAQAVDMRGVSWIEHPENYAMVDLGGTLSQDGRTISGKVDFTGCSGFRVTREGGVPTGKTKPGPEKGG